MAYSRNAVHRYGTNSRISSRAKQFLFLIGAIIIGMIVSAAVNALPSSKSVSVATKVNVMSTSIRN